VKCRLFPVDDRVLEFRRNAVGSVVIAVIVGAFLIYQLVLR
jgi:hypothetical protein